MLTNLNKPQRKNVAQLCFEMVKTHSVAIIALPFTQPDNTRGLSLLIIFVLSIIGFLYMGLYLLKEES